MFQMSHGMSKYIYIFLDANFEMHTKHSNIYIGHICYLGHIENLILNHQFIKEVIFLFCMFCLSGWGLLNHDALYCTLSIVGKLSTRKGAPSLFHNVLTYNGEVIEYWKKNHLSKNWNDKIIWAHSWYYLEALNFKDLMKTIWNFLDLRCEKYWILNYFCHWKFIELQTMVLVRKISQG